MGMPFTQSITLIQRCSEGWNLLLREAMGCSRVTQTSASKITGKHTTTAVQQMVKRRRCMLSWERAIPTTTSLANIICPHLVALVGLHREKTYKFFGLMNLQKMGKSVNRRPQLHTIWSIFGEAICRCRSSRDARGLCICQNGSRDGEPFVTTLDRLIMRRCRAGEW